MPITKPAGFSIGSGEPVDDRIVKATIAARNDIPIARRFFGMVVRVISDPDASLNKEYFLPYPEEWLDGEGETPLADYLGNDYWQVSASQIDVMQTTYDELVSLIGAASLIQGRKYLITDFATTHYFLDGDAVISSALNVATPEPIIVTAASSNSLDVNAISTIYPQDILHYDWNPVNFLNDIGFCHNSTNIITGFKGAIIYRYDTKQDVSLFYDFRGVKFRRWKLNPTPWSNVTTYGKGDKVLSGTKVYASLRNSNTNNNCSSTNWWVELLDLSVSEFLSFSSSITNGIPADSSSFIDVYTFSHYENVQRFISNTSRVVQQNPYPVVSYQTRLSNTVFLSNTAYFSITQNITGFNFRNNTFLLSINYNDFGDNFHNNIINKDFQNNKIGSLTNYNIIAPNFKQNVLTFNFTYNLIGYDFKSNFISQSFGLNVIGYGFSNNSIGPNFTQNVIGNCFYYNKIGYNFYNNIIFNDFQDNIVANDFESNSIADYCTSNVFQKKFSGNTMTQNFRRNLLTPFTQSINFTSATHVYLNYDCTIFSRPDGTKKLSYVNNSDVTIIVSPTA